MSEYKEFWIQASKMIAHDSKPPIVKECFHVIEYAAFEKAQQEIAALKEENDKLTKLFSIQLDVMKTNEELIEENQKLKAGLVEARDTLNEVIKDRERWHLFPVIVPAIVRFNALLGKE